MSRSRRRSKARRRLASVGFLPSVMIGSATLRSSLAFGSVVLIASCLSSETVMLRSIARRWLLVRLSFLSPWRGRILYFPFTLGLPALLVLWGWKRLLCEAGNRPV